MFNRCKNFNTVAVLNQTLVGLDYANKIGKNHVTDSDIIIINNNNNKNNAKCRSCTVIWACYLVFTKRRNLTVCTMVLFGLLNLCHGGSSDFTNETVIIFSWWWLLVELCLGTVRWPVSLPSEGKTRLILLVGVYFHIGPVHTLSGSDTCWQM